MNTWRVVGIGNPDRGDDGVGPAVLAALEGTPGLELRCCRGEGLDLLDMLDAAPRAVLVDAAAGGVPGTIRRFDLAAGPLPAQATATSSHGLGLGDTLELARSLGALPRVCLLYTLTGAAFDPGTPLSAGVRAAVPELARRIAALAAPQEAADA